MTAPVCTAESAPSAPALALAVARWTQPDFYKMARETGKPQLLTVPHSHFCEMARWALEHAGVDYEHRPYAPGAFVLPVLNVRMGGPVKHLSSSSKKGSDPLNTGGSGATSVPLCVLPDGETVLPDSWSVCTELANFKPLPRELMKVLDDELGPLSRLVAYQGLLRNDGNREIWDSLATLRNPGFFWWLVGNRVTAKMAAKYQVGDDGECERTKERLAEVYERLAPEAERREAKLAAAKAAHGTAHDSIDLGDIALAALAAPALMPEEYCLGDYQEEFGALYTRDSAIREDVDKRRATPLGRFALQMYREYRQH